MNSSNTYRDTSPSPHRRHHRLPQRRHVNLTNLTLNRNLTSTRRQCRTHNLHDNRLISRSHVNFAIMLPTLKITSRRINHTSIHRRHPQGLTNMNTLPIHKRILPARTSTPTTRLTRRHLSLSRKQRRRHHRTQVRPTHSLTRRNTHTHRNTVRLPITNNSRTARQEESSAGRGHREVTNHRQPVGPPNSTHALLTPFQEDTQ